MGRYRKVIDFNVVKESEKAVLILVKDCKSTAFRKLVKKAKKHSVLNPLEVWVPKKWIKHDIWVDTSYGIGNLEVPHDRYWIWEQGFLQNLCDLFNDRVKNNKIDMMPEEVKNESVH